VGEPALGKYRFTSLPAVVAAVFVLLLLIPVHISNRQIFHLINGLHSPFTDAIWLTFTTAGDGLFLGIIVGAFVVKNPRVPAMGLILLVFSSVVVHLIKAAFPTPRPAMALEAIHVVGPLLRSGSFPSGHAASGISAALAVWYCYDSRIAGPVAIVIGALIGLSRVFVGAHFPQDVLGGAACAFGCFALVVSFVWPAVERRVPDRPIVTRRSFRTALLLEVLTTVFAIVFWSPFCAESAVAGLAVGIVVLACFGYGYWNPGEDCSALSWTSSALDPSDAAVDEHPVL